MSERPSETSGSGDARDRILCRVRRALRGRDAPPHPGVRQAAGVPTAPVAERFAERLRENGGEAVRFPSVATAARWLEELAGEFSSMAAGPRLLERRRPDRSDAPDVPEPPAIPGPPDIPDPPEIPGPPGLPDLPHVPPAEADLGISVGRAAVAETGSVLLDGREGRRLQTLPPTHLVWVREADVVATLDEALERIRHEAPAAFALHSGPSKSADLGGHLVRGVHGPGRLIVAVVAGP